MGFGVRKIRGDVSGNSQAIVMGGMERGWWGRPAQTAGPVWVGSRQDARCLPRVGRRGVEVSPGSRSYPGGGTEAGWLHVPKWAGPRSQNVNAPLPPLPVRYHRGIVIPSNCCSTLLCPCRSEFTDTILSVHPSDVLDMPVDPNEPTYCLCHQVSYGEMIGCDNPDVSVGHAAVGFCRKMWGLEMGSRMLRHPPVGPWAGSCTRWAGVGMGEGTGGGMGRWQTLCVWHTASYMLTAALPLSPAALQCPIEWFHFACVDLTTKPKGKWSVCCSISFPRMRWGWLGLVTFPALAPGALGVGLGIWLCHTLVLCPWPS